MTLEKEACHRALWDCCIFVKAWRTWAASCSKREKVKVHRPNWPMLHVAPSQPGEHLHLKMSPSSWHVPPLLHVASSHWLSPKITVDPIVFLTPSINASTNKNSTNWVGHKNSLSYGSGRFFPSSHFYIRSRNRSPGLDMLPCLGRGSCCSHLCLKTLGEKNEKMNWKKDKHLV